jgi:FlaG/FlaF family flagellin (archaellin)
MKTLITTIALATLIATPVFAQTKHTSAQARTQVQKHSTNGSWDVYVGGKYIGSDPDPTIRSQLINDPAQGGNGSASGGGE